MFLCVCSHTISSDAIFCNNCGRNVDVGIFESIESPVEPSEMNWEDKPQYDKITEIIDKLNKEHPEWSENKTAHTARILANPKYQDAEKTINQVIRSETLEELYPETYPSERSSMTIAPFNRTNLALLKVDDMRRIYNEWKQKIDADPNFVPMIERSLLPETYNTIPSLNEAWAKRRRNYLLGKNEGENLPQFAIGVEGIILLWHPEGQAYMEWQPQKWIPYLENLDQEYKDFEKSKEEIIQEQDFEFEREEFIRLKLLGDQVRNQKRPLKYDLSLWLITSVIGIGILAGILLVLNLFFFQGII